MNRVDIFNNTAKLLSGGLTFSEVVDELISMDPFLTRTEIQMVYRKYLKKARVTLTADQEVERIKADLEAIMYKAMKRFNASIGDVTVSKIINRTTQDGYVNSEEITTKFQNGDPKYLTIFLNALEKYKDLVKPAEPLVNVNNNFATIQVVDDSPEDKRPIPTPFTSEREVEAFYKIGQND